MEPATDLSRLTPTAGSGSRTVPVWTWMSAAPWQRKPGVSEQSDAPAGDHLGVYSGVVKTIPGLDAGETAAIALAEEVQAGRLIIDEYRGRKATTERGLRVVGTVGVLELAAEMGFIDLKGAFERVKQTDFWISHKLLDERLALFLGADRPHETDRLDHP